MIFLYILYEIVPCALSICACRDLTIVECRRQIVAVFMKENLVYPVSITKSQRDGELNIECAIQVAKVSYLVICNGRNNF